MKLSRLHGCTLIQTKRENSYLKNTLCKTCFLCKLFQILGIRIVVDGKIGLHSSKLMVFEGSPHSLGLLTRTVLRVSVHGIPIIFIAA